jgi:hypothetical protein
MKSLSLLAAMAVAAITPSLASAQAVHPLLGGALTTGGDKLATLVYNDGTSSSIRAGGVLQIWAGLEVRPADSPFAFQGTIGYHADAASASNGDLLFERFPIEGTVLWRLDPHVRIGAGIRYAMGAQLQSTGVASNVPDVSFDSQLAPLVQLEFLFTDHMGMQLRYVQEKYTVHGQSDIKIDGSHGGIGFNYYF